MSSLINASDLQELLKAEDVILLDVSPPSNKAGLIPQFPNEMISDTFVVSIKKELSETNTRFPNTFPSAGIFNSFCRSVGINEDSTIVVYDNLGLYSSPRVWWIFKTMGFNNIYVLNGGLTAWKESGGETVQRKIIERPNSGSFSGTKELTSVKSFHDVVDNLQSKKFHVVDARSASRFNGSAPEPRPHLRSGSIKDSTNVPFKNLLNDGKMKSADELSEIFKELNKESELTFSCGSGMTACIVLLAAEQVLDTRMSIYDGSWAEWAELQGLLV